MADSSNSDGVGGVSGVGGTDSASSAANAAASAAQEATTENVAQGLVDAATGPAGVDTNALAGAVASLQGQVSPAAAEALQSAVEAQLSPVDAGQFAAAVDAASVATVAQSPAQLARESMLTELAPGPVAGLQFDAKGQPIDTCGNPVDVASVDRSVPADETDLAKALEHSARVAGGPISGPAYAGALALGADEPTLDRVHGFGVAFDAGFGLQQQRAEQPSVTVRGPEPAGWHQTQR